jgi:hypothetical protein
MLPNDTLLKKRLLHLLDELLAHDGFGSLKIDIRLLRRGQKEVIIVLWLILMHRLKNTHQSPNRPVAVPFYCHGHNKAMANNYSTVWVRGS